MLGLLLVAVAVGLSNFAAAIAIGVSGVDARTRLRVAIVFGAFEAGLPVVGLAIGNALAESLGHSARWASAALLIAAGGYGLISSMRGGSSVIAASAASPWRLIVSGFALGLDNLVVGFALGTYAVSIVQAAIIIGLVSVTLAMIGLELGTRIGRWSGARGEQLAGVMLISVGIAIAAGVLS
jgi:manganese efflux pump family protein